jgi:FKBP-type peptidyl-prolyl cis-trans isomerase
MTILFSCGTKTPETNKIDKKEIEESLVEVNKKLVKSEEAQIEDFIARYGWEMQETGTGLRYMIYQSGSGPLAKKGQVAKVIFTVSLLNGEVCYSSDTEGIKEFKIGRGGVESGIEEGILLMKKGDGAKFIIPSHLAFGLLGDMEKIPAKAALVYDIELIELI